MIDCNYWKDIMLKIRDVLPKKIMIKCIKYIQMEILRHSSKKTDKTFITIKSTIYLITHFFSITGKELIHFSKVLKKQIQE